MIQKGYFAIAVTGIYGSTGGTFAICFPNNILLSISSFKYYDKLQYNSKQLREGSWKKGK